MRGDKIIDALSKFVIVLFTLSTMTVVCVSPTGPIGESDDYMMATIALENRLSLQILEEDIEQSKVDYPQHYEHIRASWEQGMPRFLSVKEGEVYPWYFGTYSFMCIPAKQFLRFLKLNQSYAFVITNVLIYGGTLLFVFYRLNASRMTVLFSILALACAPAVPYLMWPSAEVLIFSLVAITVVFILRGQHCPAAVTVSLAGTLNPAVMVLGMAVIVNYFWVILAERKCRSLRDIIKLGMDYIWNICKLALCFIPFVYSLFFNYAHFGVLFPQTLLGLSRSDQWLGRFIAYLFDLNLGYLPYLGIPLIIFLYLSICGFIKRDRICIVLAFAFFGTVFAYARTWHINCGMSGIARYNAWACPILLLMVFTQLLPLLTAIHIKRAGYGLLIFSIGISGILSFSAIRWPYTDFSPLAEAVLTRAPSLYNPYPYTFVSRTTHVDGGYWDDSREPVIYADKQGTIRKILLFSENKMSLESIKERVYGSDSAMQELLKEIKNISQGNKNFAYVNLDGQTGVKLRKNWTEVFDPLGSDNLQNLNEGVYGNEGDFHWIMPEATITLQGNNFTESGLQLIFSPSSKLRPLAEESLRVKIIVNDSLIKVIQLDDNILGTNLNVNIVGDELTESKNGLYYIRLETNGVYNPKAAHDSNDDRDLALQLFYIGIPKVDAATE
jgi:hypothetical protein